LHFDDLDDSFEQHSVGPLLGIADGGDGPVEQAPLLFQHQALHAQRAGQVGLAMEHGLDLPQRDAQELERHHLFQPFQVAGGIHAIARGGAARPDQAQPVVVVQCAYGNARKLSELLHAQRPVHEIVPSALYARA
jgi:hypothetical protein